MPVEVAKLVDDFNKFWPRGTDPVSKADDHIRMIKEVLQLEFELLYNKTRVFSFEKGAVVNPDCILYYEAEKAFYHWNGAYDVNNEYIVNAGSTPETAGGIGGNAWTRSTGSGFMSTVLVSDTEPTDPFQNMLWWDTNSGTFFIYYNDGTSTQWVDLFGIADQASFNTLLFRSILARLAAESGYTLVGGSFQEGAISSGFSDVVLDWNTAKFYQWHLNENKEVPAGSTPATAGGIGAGAWVDRTDVTLRSDINIVVKRFSSVADMVADSSLYVGQVVKTTAYYNDWGATAEGLPIGGNEYVVVTGGTGIADGGSYIDTVGGLQLKGMFTDGVVSAVRFGLKTNNEDSAISNSTAIEKAVAYAYLVGASVVLPDDLFYCDDVDVAYPVAIVKNSSLFGARLNKTASKSDIYHTGTGFLFNFLKQNRTTNDVDGSFLCGINIVGTTNGLGGFIVNDNSAVGNELYAKRKFKARDVSITGYKNGYGYKSYWSFSNTFENVTVWGCAVPYEIKSVYAVSHYGCVYETCQYGALELNCFDSNHYDSTIEGIKLLTGYSAPSDYDLLGGMSAASDYIGIGLRVRGGNTNLFGGYVEGNRIQFLTEDTSELCINGAYIHNTSSTEVLHQATSGVFRMNKCRLNGNPTISAYQRTGPGCACSYAQHTDNRYLSMTKPISVPVSTYVTAGEFDVYDGTLVHGFAAKRVFLGQDLQVGGYLTNTNRPHTVTAESYKTRVVNVGSSAVDRTIDLSTISTTSGFITAAQSAGNLTFSCTDGVLAGEGKDLTLVVFAAGACVVVFGSNMRASSTISLSAGQTVTISFKSAANKWYQHGSVVILNT